jgi:MoaA/NifB/PqqE/SkfB family radical SAM enzyme/GT2 family glycosyltransferase
MQHYRPKDQNTFNGIIAAITSSRVVGIEKNGRNCTIAILSFNRSEKTISLLKSLLSHVAFFEGEIVILDQGSQESESSLLHEYVSDYALNIQMHTNETNLGVAKGRNLLSELSTKDWLIFLDNDLECHGDFINDLLEVQAKTLNSIINFPLSNPGNETFANGGTFSFNLNETNKSIELVVEPYIPHVFSSNPDFGNKTALVFGGAVCIRKTTFNFLEKFDERYFVGFEDIDFALKALANGQVPTSLTKSFFVHSEKVTSKASDVEYATTRFSTETLKLAAIEFENKWGVRVWNDTADDWLKKIRKRLLVNEQILSYADEPPIFNEKKKIALIVDSENWAFSRIAGTFKSFLEESYEVDIFSTQLLEERFKSEIPHSKYFLLYLLMALDDYDVVHFFWIGTLEPITREIVNDFCREFKMDETVFRKQYLSSTKISTSFYDHYSLQESWSKKLVEQDIENFYVSSTKLQIDAKEKTGRSANSILMDGVDTNLFKPSTNLRSLESNKPVRIGWVGNSNFGGGGDRKNFVSLFEPTIDRLRNMGFDVTAVIADPSQGAAVPFDEMRNFYEGIDILICTSPFEGTPNPILEAISMGIPFVANDVGIVLDSVGPIQSQLVHQMATVDNIIVSVLKLLNEPFLYESVSKENFSQREKIDWSSRKDKVVAYFTEILSPEKTMTKFCTLPFTTPSMEPDGSIRLCSSTTIFGFEDETNMGNLDLAGGLKPVWTGDKYRNIRLKLLQGKDLTPYCGSCNYRFDAPAWMLQYHLALSQYWSGNNSKEILDLIKMWASKHEEYSERVATFSTAPHPAPLFIEQLGSVNQKLSNPPSSLISGDELPVNMDFNTLNRCNVGCVMCPPSIKIEDLGLPRDKLFTLTKEIFEEVTSGVLLNSSHFVGAYAEPLMNKELVDLIGAAKKKGSFTAITTNAMLLKEDKIVELLDAGLDMISVSLHGATKEIAEAVMRKSNFEQVSNNLSKLGQIVASRKDDLLMHINYVGMVSNISDFQSVIEFAYERGFQHVNLFALIDGDKVVNKEMSLETRPDLLKLYVPNALEKAKELGVSVYVSPAYEALLTK